MGHKVLLADDSITVQKIVKLSLTEEGIEVIAVSNGEQAVQQLETLQPDLVMADVFMPGKDGYEVCEFVKSHPRLQQTPVILLVHAFEPFDPDRAKKVGADHQLTKPFQSIRTLVTTVREMLDSSFESPSTISIPDQVKAVSAPIALNTSPTAQSANNQVRQESVALSSSTSSLSTPIEEAPPDTSATLAPTVQFAPAPLTPSDPFSMPEASLPVPLTESNGLPKSDLLPPSELAVLSTTEWLPVMSTQGEWQSATTFADSSKPEPLGTSFQPLSFATNSIQMEESADDVLELSDVLSDSMPLPMTSATSITNQFSSDVPLLAVLGNAPLTVEEPQALISLEESGGHPTVASSFDVAAGHISLPTEPPLSDNTSQTQDINQGTIFTPTPSGTMQLPEAVIEEIVNRVIQRLSTNAIQEIAWEVVPEMAELLIRKQLSQQKSLAH